MKKATLLVLLATFFSCTSDKNSESTNNTNKPTTTKVKVTQPIKPNAFPQPVYLNYPWLSTPRSETIANRIPVPEGFQRSKATKGSFAEWLRYLPLFESKHKVKLHNGSLKWNQFAHHAVVDMDVGKADLQQCADAVMRLRAEYQFSRKAYDQIHFNYTSGDRVAFDDWRKGRRPKVSGNKVKFVDGGKVSDSYTNFKSYLTQIFTYAGTMSLSKELKARQLKDIQAGDVFIQGGFPGHAVMVLDVASNEKGEKLFIIGQSYMPAQEFHVLKNKGNKRLTPWYSIEEITEELETPEWTFKQGDLKAWK